MEPRTHFVSSSDGEVDCYVSPTVVADRGVCDVDNAIYISQLVTSYLSLLADSPLSSTHGRKPRRLFNQFRDELLSRPIEKTVRLYSSLHDRLLRSLYMSDGCVIISRFDDRFKDTPVFKEYLEYYTKRDATVLQYLISFLAFAKKAMYVSEEFQAEAFRQWLGIEEELAGYTFGSLAALNSILSAVMTEPSDSLYPKFGPGAVSNDGIRDMIAKASNLRLTKKLSHFDRFRSMTDPKGYFARIGLRTDEPAEIEYSTLRFVPKDVTKARSMCMEPNSYMYLQQAVLGRFNELFKSSQYLGKFIDLRSQQRNQLLCLYGSETTQLSTIDLSAASDRVHIDLVKKIFPRKWLHLLLTTRTSKVRLPDGNIVPVHKFAPMGSALCFPVQCLVFWSVVTYVHLKRSGLATSIDCPIDRGTILDYLEKHPVNPDRSIAAEKQPYAIYGDDIICDTFLVDEVTDTLEKLGFEVNRSKSFTGDSAIRESCGVYACGGVDVTPIRFRLPHNEGQMTPLLWAALPDLINRAGRYSYYNYRRYLFQLLKDIPVKGMPVTIFEGSKRHHFARNTFFARAWRYDPKQITATVRVSDPYSHTARLRWKADYQRTEQYVLSVKVKKRVPTLWELPYVEEYAYLQDVRARYLVDANEPLESSQPRYRPEETGFGWRWIPVE